MPEFPLAHLAHLDLAGVVCVEVRRHVQLLVLHHDLYAVLSDLGKEVSALIIRTEMQTRKVVNSQVKVLFWLMRMVVEQDLPSGPGAKDALAITRLCNGHLEFAFF
jgi:hypothetical protein